MDMSTIENRQDLVDRYNEAVGAPGPMVQELQHQFLQGKMAPDRISQYVMQCEDMIEARNSMRRRSLA